MLVWILGARVARNDIAVRPRLIKQSVRNRRKNWLSYRKIRSAKIPGNLDSPGYAEGRKTIFAELKSASNPHGSSLPRKPSKLRVTGSIPVGQTKKTNRINDLNNFLRGQSFRLALKFKSCRACVVFIPLCSWRFAWSWPMGGR